MSAGCTLKLKILEQENGKLIVDIKRKEWTMVKKTRSTWTKKTDEQLEKAI
jgi:hypothetical protein